MKLISASGVIDLRICEAVGFSTSFAAGACAAPVARPFSAACTLLSSAGSSATGTELFATYALTISAAIATNSGELP
ncbi:hypothetical protein AEGHOMDF_2952 [Methylobacterium soli]|nr:hypothetical protein AEGHOMDF_2952 [Methylobacterium soli]